MLLFIVCIYITVLYHFYIKRLFTNLSLLQRIAMSICKCAHGRQTMAEKPAKRPNLDALLNFLGRWKTLVEQLHISFSYNTSLYLITNLPTHHFSFSLLAASIGTFYMLAWICIMFTRLIIDFLCQYPVIGKITLIRSLYKHTA